VRGAHGEDPAQIKGFAAAVLIKFTSQSTTTAGVPKTLFFVTVRDGKFKEPLTRDKGAPARGSAAFVDLTQVQLGPCATQVLGDFGAEIVKVERLGAGDLSRSTDPFINEQGGQSAYFMALNRNKRSIAVDMGKPEGREIVLDLARQADVLVHNFRPGVVDRLGLDYASLQSINPRLIYASGSGFGPDGPLVHKAGQDLLAQSMSGLAHRNAGHDGAPQLFPTALGDFTAGMILAQGVLLALYQRERTGQGACMHVCLLDTLLAMQQARSDAVDAAKEAGQLDHPESDRHLPHQRRCSHARRRVPAEPATDRVRGARHRRSDPAP
jgi:crotonobetainyl-CoA:carnitine CoA-transferase CaiB-like acyl-CoA transferase